MVAPPFFLVLDYENVSERPRIFRQDGDGMRKKDGHLIGSGSSPLKGGIMIQGNKFQGNLEVGMRVYGALYGGRDGIIFKIRGDQSPESIRSLGGGCVVTGGSATIDVVFAKGTISRGIPESIVRGVQWSISDGDLANEEEIQHALAYAELESRRKEMSDKEEAQAKEECRKAFLAAHPELTPVDPEKYDSLTKGGKNLRRELKDAFPETKFSVRSRSYSGGDSIDINWTDGPTTEVVEKISGKYQQGDFNGMEDIYEYSNSNVWPDVFGGAKYVMTNRSYSNEAYLQAVAEVEKEWAIKLKVSYTSFNSAYISNEDDKNVDDASNARYWSGSQLVNRKLSETDFRKQ
ncbi:hypothetical protein LCGC14_0489360 [marine sediment metagenome]|uniref:Large polyvalent protein associated domain-containing protein n=1 Tax=marine sediment metagenome TaxID=412755 RepID=A0A0F9SQB1_9ZZZZ